jgi:hypothetical protein
MLKKTIEYTDYNGNERTEDFYFNLSKAEVYEMEMSTAGGLETYINKIISTKDSAAIVSMFKDLIVKSYGEKSDDGRRFIKSEELSNDFEQTEAYANLFVELSTDADKAAAFVNGILPKDMSQDAKDNSKLSPDDPKKVLEMHKNS